MSKIVTKSGWLSVGPTIQKEHVFVFSPNTGTIKLYHRGTEGNSKILFHEPIVESVRTIYASLSDIWVELTGDAKVRV